MGLATRLLGRLWAWVAPVDPGAVDEALPSLEESAFFGQECVKCGSEFDVPPTWAFDRRRAHYCDECLPRT
jgi:hypothetical protein